MSRIRRVHEVITGVTPDGQLYRANDPELLTWVHVTAAYGFLNRYRPCLSPGLTRADQDRYYQESLKVCGYYGLSSVPNSVAEVETYFERMRPRLQHHEILAEFLALVLNSPVISRAVLPVQPLPDQAAIDLLPTWSRELFRHESRSRLVGTIRAAAGGP